MVVVLIGYMGSGKSTIGKELSTVLNYKFLDLDDYISEQEGISIPEIFNKKGEIYFRKQESLYLKEVIKNSENLVLALGGGTPCYADNMEVLNREEIISFYLKLSIPSLTDRLFNERTDRPLINHLDSKDDLQEFIGKHLFERSSYYNKAKYALNIDGETKQDVIELVLMQLI